MGRIKILSAHIDKPWLVIGDFYEVVNQIKKTREESNFFYEKTLYANTINDCNLININLNGPTFTWNNKRKLNPIYERLDRGWAIVEWLNLFPHQNLWHLTQSPITAPYC